MLTQERLKELLHYDPETGVFTNRVARGRLIVGVEAGCVTTGGYIKLSVCNKRYYGHRLAWLYVFGQWPNDELDHINLVTSDNRIANLREATKAQNNSNCSVRSHSKSGKKGVDFVQSTGKWRAKLSK